MPAAAAIRMRRHREREAAGHILVHIELSQAETEILRRLNLLGEHELEDRVRIGEAVHGLIASVILDP
jgi:hypothetical protein